MNATFLRDMPLARKLRTLLLAVSGAALLAGFAVFLVFQWVSARSALVDQLSTMADIVGDQSTAALEFDQKEQAAAILASLRAQKPIIGAAIYDRAGRPFAHYGTEAPLAPGPDGVRHEAGAVVAVHPMVSDRERIGTIYLRSDLSLLWQRLWVNLGVALATLVATLIAVVFISGWIARVVTDPILKLNEVVHEVSAKRDYSVRAEKQGADEVGSLIDGFNDMLVEVQTRDDALARAQSELEKRVEERTRELLSEVAERRAAQQQLQEKDARLTEAQEVAQLGSWEWNVASGAVSWSDEVYRIYGLMPGRFGGRIADFVASAHPDDRAAFGDAFEKARATREPLSADYRVFRPDGSVRILHARAKVALDDAGRAARVVGTLQDVTVVRELNRELQKRMEQLAAANKELESFSYSVSHDLRAPLRAIDGYSRMLIEDFSPRLDDEGRRYLGVIMENARRMGQLIDDLLEFARMGRRSMMMIDLDMQRLAQQVADEQKGAARGRSVDVRIDPLPPAHGDPAMFRQVFVNLISNAFKYSRDRKPAVIEVGGRRAPEETVYFVRDNGVGFDMEYAHKLFGVFQRLHGTKEFEGTGVGLALVNRIVQRHGGRVWAEGAVNAGATFYFSLPNRKEADHAGN